MSQAAPTGGRSDRTRRIWLVGGLVVAVLLLASPIALAATWSASASGRLATPSSDGGQTTPTGDVNDPYGMQQMHEWMHGRADGTGSGDESYPGWMWRQAPATPSPSPSSGF